MYLTVIIPRDTFRTFCSRQKASEVLMGTGYDMPQTAVGVHNP